MTQILLDGHGPVSAPDHFDGAVAASAKTRIAARIIDGIIPIVLAIPTTVVAWGVPLVSETRNPMELIGVAWVGSAFSFLVAVAMVAMIMTRGQTFGMKIMGLRWVSMSDGTVHGGACLLKFLAECVLASVGATPIIWLFTRDNLGRHWLSRVTHVVTINVTKGRDTDTTPAPTRQVTPDVPTPQPWQANGHEERPAGAHTPQTAHETPVSPVPAGGTVAGSPAGDEAPAGSLPSGASLQPSDDAAERADEGQGSGIAGGEDTSAPDDDSSPASRGEEEPHSVGDDVDRTVARRPANSILLSFDDGTHHYLVGQALMGRSPEGVDSHPNAQLISISDPDRSISKLHIALTVHSGAVLVEDMHSLNGTTIITHEGQTIPVMPGAPILAPAGSTVYFGERTVKIGG